MLKLITLIGKEDYLESLEVTENGIVITEYSESIGTPSVQIREIDDMIALSNKAWKKKYNYSRRKYFRHWPREIYAIRIFSLSLYTYIFNFSLWNDTVFYFYF